MIGIDATHAWASVWTPQNQWLGLDPTNDQMVDERYIVVGFGRDYADVPPLRGIIYTDSESSTIDVAVDGDALRADIVADRDEQGYEIAGAPQHDGKHERARNFTQ
jgi:transglutaminase-like putative cysteine protease